MASIAYQFGNIALTAADPLLEPELRHSYGMRQEDSALVFLIIAGTWALSTPFIGKFVGQSYCMDSLLVIVIGLVLCAAGFLLAGPYIPFGIVKQLWLICLSLGLLGLSYAMIYIASQEIIYNVDCLGIPKEVNRTAIKSLMSAVWRVSGTMGSFMGFTLSGALGQAIGWEWTMSAFGFTSLLLIIPTLYVKFRNVAKTSFEVMMMFKEMA